MSRLATILAFALALGAAGRAWPLAVDDLLSDGHLAVQSSVYPDTAVVPGQKLQLTLTVATDTWFTGGTRIVIPEVPGLVILQNEQFAANASENRGGKTWVVQRWSLDVFAQREGDFTTGPITLRIKVNGGDAGEVRGEVLAPAASFSAIVPDSLKDVEHWLAAPRFSVRQSFDRDPGELAVGDAIEQDIVFEATDVMAMMLPAYEPAAPAGLAAYPEPPQLDNSINRGELKARRRQVISYVVEAPGEFVLPAREFFWWDTKNASLQLVTLPETRIAVSGTAAAAQPEPGLDRALLLRGALGLVALAALVLIGRLAYRLFPTSRAVAALRAARGALAELGRPALPDHLNPGHINSRHVYSRHTNPGRINPDNNAGD